MAEETERRVKEEQGEISDEVFVKEPQKQGPVVEDQQVNVLPDNEEEKEEILLTTASVASPHKAKSAIRKRQPKEISSADIGKHLKRQTDHLNKVTTTVQSIQKDSKSTIGQIKLIKQMQSQLKQLQNQLTQIQKFITKKNFAIKSTRLRKRTINTNRSRKKR
ncbi:MAG: hypothetical protein WBZ36_12900 [Candidatus Nitrosopolaris sp.]